MDRARPQSREGWSIEAREGIANRTQPRTYPEYPCLCGCMSETTDKLTLLLMNQDNISTPTANDSPAVC